MKVTTLLEEAPNRFVRRCSGWSCYARGWAMATLSQTGA